MKIKFLKKIRLNVISISHTTIPIRIGILYATDNKMSVSIFNTFHYDNEFSVMKFNDTKMHNTTPRSKLDHVRRNLFGPVDRKECSR